MHFEDYIGFLISLLAIVYVVGRRVYEAFQKRKHPEYQKEQEHQKETLKKFLKELRSDMEEDEEKEEKENLRGRKKVSSQPPPPPFSSSSRTLQKHKTPPKRQVEPVQRTVKDQFSLKTELDQFKEKIEKDTRKYSDDYKDRYETQDYGKELGEHVVSKDMDMEESAQHAYEISRKSQVPRAMQLLKGLHSKKHMMMIHEILSPPKSLRKQ